MTRSAPHRATGALAFAFALACLFAGAAPSVAGATPGALDLGFSGDGLLTSDFGRGDSRAAAVIVQPDGRIVTVGHRADRFTGPGSLPDFALARYDADGTLDETFDGDGRQTTSFTPDVDQATAVALQPADGKIVVAGRAGGSEADFAVARYETDGSLDDSFSGDGLQTIDLGAYSEAAAVAVQADGAIVVTGTVGTGLGADFALARLEADGDPDASFGDAGIVTTNIDTADRAAAVALQPDGLIVVAGSAATSTGFTTDDNLFAVARYEADGDLDPAFGDGGIRTAVVNNPHGGWAAAAALDGDGRIVVAGATSLSEIAVVRFETDGDLDATFSDDGLALTAGSLGVGVAIGPSDDTVTVLARAGTFSGTMLARYDESGDPDASIGIDGTRRFDDIATPSGLALQPDGKVVATGSAGYYAASHDFVVARRNADGSPDTSFAGDGSQTTEFAGAGGDEAAAVAVGSDGSIVAAGSSDADEGFETTGTGDLVLARYDAAGTPSLAFSADGVVTDDRIQGASAVARQADGRIVAAGRSGGDLAIVRYNADGTRDAGFGSLGMLVTDFGSGGDRAAALALAPGGKIVVAGSGGSDQFAGAGDFALARYDAERRSRPELLGRRPPARRQRRRRQREGRRHRWRGEDRDRRQRGELQRHAERHRRAALHRQRLAGPGLLGRRAPDDRLRRRSITARRWRSSPTTASSSPAPPAAAATATSPSRG